MKKFTKLINESVQSMTWGQLVAEFQNDIDFVNCRPEDILSHRWKMRGDTEWRTMDSKPIGDGARNLTNIISVYDEYNFILVCKNNDPLAIISVYEQHGCTNFKNIIVVYGHGEIVFYDCDDFTHKKIHTR